jgi:ATP sulfurylase
MPAANTASSKHYTIPTLLERKGAVIFALAYCPVCDKVEKSNGEGHGQQYALDTSVAKIRAHLRMAHRIF